MSALTPAIVELRGISYHYPQLLTLRRSGLFELSLGFQSGKIYGVVGPNGAGKSTLFKLLSGALKPKEGEIYFCGSAVSRWPLWRRARLGVGYLSQHGSLAARLSVDLNLRLGLSAGKRWGMELSRPHETLEGTYEQLIKEMGLSELKQQRVSTLSGGERRRCELAKLILQRPRVLLLDEPFAALDRDAIGLTLHLINRAKAWGAMVLLTDHQNTYVNKVCDEIITLNEGRVIQTPPQDCLHEFSYEEHESV